MNRINIRKDTSSRSIFSSVDIYPLFIVYLIVVTLKFIFINI